MMSHSHDEDIDFEPEDDPSRRVEDEAELGSLASLQAKLKKLREELAVAKKERQEYLDGWQRSKADAVNTKREDAARIERMGSMIRESFVEDLLPTLDAFDMAMQGDAWQKVDQNWRSGVEHIRTNLLKVLEQNSVEAFGKAGEMFDHALHEAVQEEEGEAGVILRVLRRGYKAGEKIIRPAQVVVGK